MNTKTSLKWLNIWRWAIPDGSFDAFLTNIAQRLPSWIIDQHRSKMYFCCPRLLQNCSKIIVFDQDSSFKMKLLRKIAPKWTFDQDWSNMHFCDRYDQQYKLTCMDQSGNWKRSGGFRTQPLPLGAVPALGSVQTPWLVRASKLRKSVIFGCAVPTGSGIILNEVKPTLKDSLCVIGLGGVGLSILMACKKLKLRNIIVVEIDKKKINIAKKLGYKKNVIFKKNVW